jgi:hypothetical protein
LRPHLMSSILKTRHKSLLFLLLYVAVLYGLL